MAASTLFDVINNTVSNSMGGVSIGPVSTNTETKSIFDQAVLLSLELKSFGTSRKLADTEYEADAAKDKTRASKRLLDSKELKEIRKYDGETRRLISAVTLPSQFRAGLYLLPIASLERIDEQLRERQLERANLVDVLCQALPTIKYTDALPADQGGLGSLYNEADYPTASALRDAFSMAYNYTEFSAPGRLKSLSMAIYEREKEKAGEIWKSALEEGKALLRAQFLSLVEHMQDRLTPGPDGKAKKFKGSLVGNLQEFLDNFSARNLCDDDALASLVEQAAKTLKGVSPDDLRSSETVKARVTAGMDTIKASLDSLVGAAPVRAINLNSDEWGDI